jgi:hypothetical protein
MTNRPQTFRLFSCGRAAVTFSTLTTQATSVLAEAISLLTPELGWSHYRFYTSNLEVWENGAWEPYI